MARLDSDLVGRRLVVRSLVPGETGPSGGSAMTDVIGRLVSYADDVAVLERRDGELVRVPAATVVTAKVVPDGPRRRRTKPALAYSAEELTAICTRGWPPIESAPLGDWLLRAAGGFTNRANSVAVHGNPGTSTEQALARVTEFYAERGLPARAQVVAGSRWSQALDDVGWRQRRAGPDVTGPDGAIVQVVDLAVALRAAGQDDPQVEVRDRLDADWVGLYHRANDVSLDDARGVLEGATTTGFVRIGDPLLAIGRVAVTGEWAGLSCVEVAPDHRREGLARRVVEASLRWASGRGADKAYVQTTRRSHAGSRLYRRYGFTDHHEYCYVTPAG